jgi:hypothetical protein
MAEELAHFFSVRENGSKHWKIVSFECLPGEEDLNADRQRELSEWIGREVYPLAQVKYLTTALDAKVVKRLPRKMS